MEISKDQALVHFKQVVLPRRTRDEVAEARNAEGNDQHKVMWRKMLPGEEDKSEPYPVCSAGLKTFAHFGIGIGIYFMQLLILSAITFVSGLIMAVAIQKYNSSSYGISSSSNPLLLISAACASVETVNAKVDSCSGFSDCSNGIARLDYRPDCEFPFHAGLADMAMSIFFFLMIFAAKYAEGELEEELDEAVQSAQDYSVVVEDPNKDAEDPDEWYDFFSRFGKVRYITITRKNKALTSLITQKHAITNKIMELSKVSHVDEKAKQKEIKLNQQFEILNEKLDQAYRKSYSICKVYVTFEYEEGQRLCLRETEIPDIYAMLDIRTERMRNMFRDSNVLNIVEPPEPDSILWENVEMTVTRQSCYKLISLLVTLLVFALLYLIVIYVRQVSILLLAALIGVIDAALPKLFEILTDLSVPHDEGRRQADIQVRLFIARLLLSVVFPYLASPWNEVLTEAFLQQILITQLTASFVAPLIQLSDVVGLAKRHIMGPLTSDTQGELNAQFIGSRWTLAEKYTGITKVLFLALFYALLNPFSLFIATIAFIAVFFIDRYLLLRRWMPVCMLDAHTARRLRQQAFLAIAAHMYITLRYIYSWPMDQVFESDRAKDDDVEYEYADKYPSFAVPFTAPPQDWHNSAQKNMLLYYRIVFFVVLFVTVYIWVIDPLVHMIKKMFCYSLDVVGQSQGISFSAVEKIVAYVPLIKYKTEYYVCSYVKDMKEENKPSLIRPTPGDIDDLSGYVPIQHQPHVLSVVKYYGDTATLDDIMEKGAAGSGSPGKDQMRESGDNHTASTEGARPLSVRIEDDDDDDDMLGVDPRKRSTTQKQLAKVDNTRPKYHTNEQGVLEKIVSGLPADLAAKIRNKSVKDPQQQQVEQPTPADGSESFEFTPSGRRAPFQSNFGTRADYHSADQSPAREASQQPPSLVKSSAEKSRRRIKRHRGLEASYAPLARGHHRKVGPADVLGARNSPSDQIYSRSYDRNTGKFAGSNPSSGASGTSNQALKANRVILKPLF